MLQRVDSTMCLQNISRSLLHCTTLCIQTQKQEWLKEWKYNFGVYLWGENVNMRYDLRREQSTLSYQF